MGETAGKFCCIDEERGRERAVQMEREGKRDYEREEKMDRDIVDQPCICVWFWCSQTKPAHTGAVWRWSTHTVHMVSPQEPVVS